MDTIIKNKANKKALRCEIGGAFPGNLRTKQTAGEKEKKARMPRKSEEEFVFRCGSVPCKAEQKGFPFDSS